jgi:crotonobetainyl-CoA:carnitine CoA-transferase CaiB-like acyl-CoA transferase
MFHATKHTLTLIWTALGGALDWPERVQFVGEGDLPSVFAVSDLAGASIGAACLAVAELLSARHGSRPQATVDRRLASFWFGASIRPQGWKMPAPWDAVAGDYRAADGWIRLHTNAPHHRAAALAVLGVAADRDEVARAVGTWQADALETSVVQNGGCAAAMRDVAAWTEHPQGRAVLAEPLLIHEPGTAAPPPRWAIPQDRPLHGVRVLDLTRVLAGPVATRFLAGFGAEVLRIDPPGWDEPSIEPDMTLGKRCTRLDLRQPSDREVWERLLSQADVLVHGYRPGALAGLGLDADRRHALRPDLVDVALDAYGWSGPWQGRRGFDSLVQMSAGIADAGMRRLGRDRPTPLPVQALDHATGYLMAAAVVRGLTRRLATGCGGSTYASLARTAGLLVNLLPGEPVPFAPETLDDHADTMETTAWGAARRVKAPGSLEGASMRWDLPAAALGSAPAAWTA